MRDLDSDIESASIGRDIKQALPVIELFVTQQTDTIVRRMMSRIDDSERGPLRDDEAKQAWMQLHAVNTLLRSCLRSVRDGEQAAKRVPQPDSLQ